MEENYKVPLFVNNKRTFSGSKVWIDVHDPATGECIGRVPESTADEVENAIKSSHLAFQKWSKTSVIKRQQLAFKLVELLKEHQNSIATLIVKENGKTFSDALADVFRGIQMAEQACACTTELKGSVLEVSNHMETIMIKEPIGVVVSICPFNFPAMVPLWTLPLVLATGNTLVLKPSERTPSAAVLIAELCEKAGYPENVVTVVHGSTPTVKALITAPLVEAVTFVGSSNAGNQIYRTATHHGKRCQANKGAKNHIVFLPDADKTTSIQNACKAAFGAAGQRRMAISVVVAVGETANWIPDLVDEAKKYTVGPGFNEETDIGPLISQSALSRAKKIVTDSEKQGAKVILDGREFLHKKFPNGYFLGPTILQDVTLEMPCYVEEIFAPVLVVLTAPSLEAAIRIVNANPYGNGVCLMTSSGASAHAFEKNIECGQVGINVPIPVPLPMFGFTGSKGSFSGDLNFYGESGIRFLTKFKTITSYWKSEEVDIF